MKWFMPPMPRTGSWMQAATQDPSVVAIIRSGRSLTACCPSAILTVSTLNSWLK